jgi:flagellar biosynthesis GTPase FlhF
MIKSIVLSVSVLVAIVFAEDAGVKPLQQEHQQLFEKRKALEEQSHNERIRILHEADNCVKGAKTPDEYRACEKKENESRQQLKEQQIPQHEALKQERDALKEKGIKMHEERMKNKAIPRGTIETH